MHKPLWMHGLACPGLQVHAQTQLHLCVHSLLRRLVQLATVLHIHYTDSSDPFHTCSPQEACMHQPAQADLIS